jgi:segregation and condensation protein A
MIAGLAGQLVLDLDGFEGPIDLLLILAREQKVDITQISILELADQYLAFVLHAQQVQLELAADYLVMAAWLAYLKSRLLLPDDHTEEQPTGQQMADALAFQLKRLQSMQDMGARLFARPLLHRDTFTSGAPEGIEVVTEAQFEPTLYELLKAYGEIRSRDTDTTLHIAPQELYSVEQAVERLRSLLGAMPDWNDILAFLPEGLKDGILKRSAVASTFAATLELVREGRAELRQDGAFRPIFIRQSRGKE